jgi:hypothetical protein
LMDALTVSYITITPFLWMQNSQLAHSFNNLQP